MNKHIAPVELEKAYRLLNHGPTVLVSASHGGIDNVMAAAWSCALDFSPPKVTVVLDKTTKTRELVERSGYFALQVPNLGQVQLTYNVGNHSLADTPDKLEKYGVELFHAAGQDTPLVAGCSAWLICKLIPEPHNQQTYDLFIGEVVGAWPTTASSTTATGNSKRLIRACAACITSLAASSTRSANQHWPIRQMRKTLRPNRMPKASPGCGQ